MIKQAGQRQAGRQARGAAREVLWCWLEVGGMWLLPKKLLLISRVTMGLPNICFHVHCKKLSSVLKISSSRSRSDAMKKRSRSANCMDEGGCEVGGGETAAWHSDGSGMG